MSEFLDKKLVIIGGGLLQLPVIKKAKELGIKTLVVDMNPKAIGVKEADYYIPASTMEPENCIYFIDKYIEQNGNINGVLTVGTDASYTVAVIAEKFKLPGIKPEVAIAATDKYIMRKTLRSNKVPVPDFEIINSYPEAIEVFERLGSDCVVKPVKNMGARGVRRVNNIDELKDAFDLALHYSKSGQIIIEKYIDSPELSIDALIYNNNIYITGVADRIIEYDPYFVETGHIMPSQLPQDLIHLAIETFTMAIKAIGINIGAAKGDIKVSENGCYIGEIAARLSGGFMSTHTFPYSTGIDLMENIIRISLGLSPENLTPKIKWCSIERAIIAAPGVIKKISGLEEAKNIKFVKDIFFDNKIGDRVESPKNNLDKSGHIIVAAPTFDEALKASHEARRTIKIFTEEDDDQLIPENTINERAKLKFNNKCFVCPDCDGKKCRGMIPGVGGIGTGDGFVNSIERVRKYNIIPSYINNVKYANIKSKMFEYELDLPVVAAPITGSVTNLGGAISELDLARAIVKGSYQAGTIGFIGDGANPTKYKIATKVILENFGYAIPIFKPRYDNKLIIERIQAAKKAGAIGVGIDIDAASFITMEMKGQLTSTKSFSELKELIDIAEIPFFVKGILSIKDAEQAVKAGAKGIIISNHGGRVNDSLVAPIDVLRPIRKALGDEILIILDGGIRSGTDVLKALILGADLVMIGRPIMIYAVGGGIQGVRQYLKKIGNELKKSMILVGIDDIKNLRYRDDLLQTY